MQMNFLSKVSLNKFRAASSSDAVKPTPCARIGLGRTGAAMLANGSNTPFTWNYLDGSDLKSSLVYPNGLTASWQYDVNGQLLQVKNAFPNNTISQYDYIYDAAGRRIQITRSGSAMTENRTDFYGYNTRGELVSGAKLGGPSSLTAEYAYQYDDIGNRLTSLDLGTNRTYTANNLNQYTLVGRGDPTAPEEEFIPQFDDDGNQTLIKTSTGIWSVTYNGENRPTFWTCIQSNNSNNTNNQTISMSYDRMGRRVTKNAQRFIYDGYLQIANFEHQTSNIKHQTFIWDPTEPIATRPLVWSQHEGSTALNFEPSTLNFYTHDGNKNVSEVVAGDGSTTAHYEYAPFGDITVQRSESAVVNHWRFSSEYVDVDIARVYYNYRHYDPALGRWEAVDPVNDMAGYNYVQNNSLTFFDLLGLENMNNVPEISPDLLKKLKPEDYMSDVPEVSSESGIPSYQFDTDLLAQYLRFENKNLKSHKRVNQEVPKCPDFFWRPGLFYSWQLRKRNHKTEKTDYPMFVQRFHIEYDVVKAYTIGGGLSTSMWNFSGTKRAEERDHISIFGLIRVFQRVVVKSYEWNCECTNSPYGQSTGNYYYHSWKTYYEEPSQYRVGKWLAVKMSKTSMESEDHWEVSGGIGPLNVTFGKE